VLDRALPVVAESVGPGLNAIVQGTITVRDIPAGAVASLAGMWADHLEIRDCDGTVFGDVLNLGPSSVSQGPGDDWAVEIVDAADVRLRQFGLNPGNGSGRGGVLVLRSRLETDGAAIDGARGVAGKAGAPHGGDGGVGIECGEGSVVHIANSRIRGGNGGDALFSFGGDPWFGGDGAPAFLVRPGATLAANGTIEMQVFGGWAGKGAGGLSDCAHSGQPGPAFEVEASGAARVSADVVVDGGFSTCFGNGPPVVGAGAAALVFADPPDPDLHFSGGIASVGVEPAFHIVDEVGSQVLLFVGITPAMQSFPKWQANPLLVHPILSLPAGSVPAAGEIVIPILIPANVPVGLPIIVQAATRRLDGTFFLTNSTTAITTPPPPPPDPPNPTK
jgi:hypothetical protein